MQFTTATLFAAVFGAFAVSAAPMEKRAHSGSATYYFQNGNAGSCGNYHGDSDMIIAVPSQYGTSLCGQSVTIQHGSQQIQATVADSCPTCDGDSIDLSHGAFGQIAGYEEGMVPINWWVN